MDADGGVNHRSEHTFAEHMGESEAVSEFAKQKTLKQQREFLPIYAVRQEVSVNNLIFYKSVF